MRNTNLKEQHIYKRFMDFYVDSKNTMPMNVSLKEPKHAQCKMQDYMREVV